MKSRMRTGITVHSTSSTVLCVVRDGVGLRFSLKRTITMTSKLSTNTEMRTMIHSSLLCSWTTPSIVGVAASWKPHSHSLGFSANAAAGANANAASVAEKAPNLANTIFAPSDVHHRISIRLRASLAPSVAPRRAETTLLNPLSQVPGPAPAAIDPRPFFALLSSVLPEIVIPLDPFSRPSWSGRGGGVNRASARQENRLSARRCAASVTAADYCGVLSQNALDHRAGDARFHRGTPLRSRRCA